MTPASSAALAALRNPEHFNWAVVPLLSIVASFYYTEIGKKNWHLLAACVGALMLEFMAEIANALILHFSGHSALWTIAGNSTYLILVGINIEIYLMFAAAYFALIKILPADPKEKILGMNNRLFFVLLNSLICVVVESILNHFGVLVWDWKFWAWPHVYTIFIFAYAPSMIFLYWLYDMPSLKTKWAITVGLALCNMTGLALFAGILKWI